MTSTSLGWVILDRQGPDAFTLDHDAFDVQSTADGTTPDSSLHTAAARGVQAIATASGHKVGSVQVTWSEDMEAAAADLLKSLTDAGFDNVLPIPLNQAAQTWGIEVGSANEHDKTALCILEPGAATVMVVATGAGSVRTAVTNTRDHASDLIAWLTTIFNRDGWLPESLHLVGARADLDAVAGPIGDALPIPVFDTVDTQLALARGAALVTVSAMSVHPSQATETPANDPPSRREWPLVSHAKKVIISAAAIAVVGAAVSLAAGSALNTESVSAQAADPQAQGASVTSASVHTGPTPISAPPAPVQPLAAEPPPVPPAPPESPQLPDEPLSAAVPEPVSVPVHQQTVSAPPPAAPLAAPAPAVAAPPAAPLAVPPAPVAPPPPLEPEEPPPSPDPVQVVMSPLLSGLP
ncbi:MAG: hypothetical protein QOF67_3266 [Mycobacterium sp.]|nr:hypothetical protein [Mycobacterium sp.]